MFYCFHVSRTSLCDPYWRLWSCLLFCFCSQSIVMLEFEQNTTKHINCQLGTQTASGSEHTVRIKRFSKVSCAFHKPIDHSCPQHFSSLALPKHTFSTSSINLFGWMWIFGGLHLCMNASNFYSFGCRGFPQTKAKIKTSCHTSFLSPPTQPF